MTDLDLQLGPLSSGARDINDRGQVVGYACCPGYAFLWENGVVTDLGPGWHIPSAINNRGQVVGSGEGHALLWEDGVTTDLGTLPGDVSSRARSINELGHVVGYSSTEPGYTRATLWIP
jgi:probable HAF family extracellular repeat protein